jgi:hypothetical protein
MTKDDLEIKIITTRIVACGNDAQYCSGECPYFEMDDELDSRICNLDESPEELIDDYCAYNFKPCKARAYTYRGICEVRNCYVPDAGAIVKDNNYAMITCPNLLTLRTETCIKAFKE